MFGQDSSSQQLLNQNLEAYYSLYDKAIGIQNTEIYNGTEIIETERVVQGKNKYFFDDSFVPATVIFDNQPYYDVEVNYNIYDDVVIVRLKNQVSKNSFKPVQEKVEGFKYKNYDFEHYISENQKDLSGFYQILGKYEGTALLKKHRQERKSKLNKKIPFYEYLTLEGDFFIKKDNRLTEIDSKSDWNDLYPEKEAVIKRYFRDNKKLKRHDKDTFVHGLYNSVSN